jgi:hypothetical protein
MSPLKSLFDISPAGLIYNNLIKKSTAPPPAPVKVDESKAEQQEKDAERRRRQVVARQNKMIQTSPLGETINQGLLGGPTLTGQ